MFVFYLEREQALGMLHFCSANASSVIKTKRGMIAHEETEVSKHRGDSERICSWPVPNPKFTNIIFIYHTHN